MKDLISADGSNGKVCVCSVQDLRTPIVNLFVTYTQESDVALPDIKISLVLFASNTYFVIVVSFSNYSNRMFPRALDRSYLSSWKETEGNVSKWTNLQSEKLCLLAL